MIEVVAVFDIGKTNKKVLLFDNRFQIVLQHEERFPLVKDEDGFECDDIDSIILWIVGFINKITTQKEYKLVGVNFSTYGASLVFLDKNGKRLTPVYNYLKKIDPSISQSLFDNYGGKVEFCRKTASPALDYLLNSGIQILWLKKEKPKAFKSIKSILHLPQYLSYCLTGKIVSEPTSIGCHTFLWDFELMNYHNWIADQGIVLPSPIANDIVFQAKQANSGLKVGIGIHDSSASLVPYLKVCSAKFILVSTGTWSITMNPFNNEPLTSYQLEQDCLCYLTPDRQQVKSSRLFMGHFHEVWVGKLAKHFRVIPKYYKNILVNNVLIEHLQQKYKTSIFFPDGKESFNAGLNAVDLKIFNSYEEAYTKFMIDLTELCVESIKLVIAENDETENISVSGGFTKNSLFIRLLELSLTDKNMLPTEIGNSSALGAALVIAKVFSKPDFSQIALGANYHP